jgi:hypothetical protein
VIARARAVAGTLDGRASLGSSRQLSLAADPPPPALARLAAIDVDRTTPLDALALLAELKTLL